MTLIGKLHTFNTGRLYGANGQEIVWAIVELETGARVVPFIDRDRGIDGVIDLHVSNLELVTDRWVLNAYDNHHYGWRGLVTDFLRDHARRAR